eukprot:scaffold31231_cov46-Tisochrysis_lutea.AAC.1
MPSVVTRQDLRQPLASIALHQKRIAAAEAIPPGERVLQAGDVDENTKEPERCWTAHPGKHSIGIHEPYEAKLAGAHDQHSMILIDSEPWMVHTLELLQRSNAP